MKFIFVIIAGLVLQGCQPEVDQSALQEAADEIHYVGVYEGYSEIASEVQECYATCRRGDVAKMGTCWRNCGQMDSASNHFIRINLDRPRKNIMLVLGSYDAVDWRIETSSKTEINSIILIGEDGDSNRVFVDGELFRTIIKRPDYEPADQIVGAYARILISTLPPEYGFERFNSFTAEYEAPEDGVTISASDDISTFLDADYLDYHLVDRSGNSDLAFDGVMAGKVGKFLPDGQVVEQKSVVRNPVTAIDEHSGLGYRYSSDSIRVLDIANNSTMTTIDVPEYVKGGHLRAMTFDPRRKRLMLIFQAGAAEAQIVSYDIATKAWDEPKLLARLVPHSLIYDDGNDRFLVSGALFPDRLFLASLSPEGFFSIIREYSPELLIGYTDLYDPDNDGPTRFLLLGVSGDEVIVGTDGAYSYGYRMGSEPLLRVYVANLVDGSVDLTYYDPALRIPEE